MKNAGNGDVIIVGAGPVGLTLAMTLAIRGISVVVIERRAAREVPTVRCNHVSARSMEIFRQLGVATALRDAGLPPDYPNDASFRTTVVGTELSRIPIPGRRTRYSDKSGPDGHWPTPEPPHRINQLYLEPILFDHAAGMAGIRIINRAEIVSFVQDEDSVTATGRELESGGQFVVTGRFLIGCDGGRSTIRKQIGANFVGDAVIQRVQSTYIKAPDLLDAMQADPAWAIVSLNPRRSGTLYAIDGVEKWIVHNYLYEHEADFEAIDRDWSIRTILGVDEQFSYEILHNEDWIGRRLVADRFRHKRVFICGDAAHIWVPYGGYGMNAGIADAANLGWLMAAHLNGWASYAILDGYEAERLPITEQVSRFAMDYAAHMIKNRRRVPANIEDDSSEGQLVRAEFGEELYSLNVQQYCCGGLNFGYFYDQSPLIAYDNGSPPAYSMSTFTPSTVPGCRTPHFWLGEDVSLYDQHGLGYACLRFNPSTSIEALSLAAQARNIPLTLIDVPEGAAPAVYQSNLLISRPDQHVAWCGDQLPADVDGLLDTLTATSR